MLPTVFRYYVSVPPLLELNHVTVLRGTAEQRAALDDVSLRIDARALVHNPQTLLLDEPSNALDIAAQLQLRQTLRDLARSGLGIVLVTHHVSEIIPEIQRVVLLRDGRIVADGPKSSVLNAEQLSSLYGVPVRLVRDDGYFHLY